jgi:hypothetical protein
MIEVIHQASKRLPRRSLATERAKRNIMTRQLDSGMILAHDLLGERSAENVELWYYQEPWSQNPTVSVYGSSSVEPVPKRVRERNRFSLRWKFRPNKHFYRNLAPRLECIHLPLLVPPTDLLMGDLAFSTDSSSRAEDGGETSPWRTIAFALTSLP